MTRIIERCPHCGARYVQITPVGAPATDSIDRPTCQWQFSYCQNHQCRKLIFVALRDGEVVRIYPPASEELSEEVTDEVTRAEFREAAICLSAGCYKASMVMARRVVERMLADRGCEGRKLVDRVQDGIQKGILTPRLAEIATEIRQYGNLGAHPDPEAETLCTEANATVLIEFVSLLADELYVTPARLARLSSQRRQSQ